MSVDECILTIPQKDALVKIPIINGRLSEEGAFVRTIPIKP